MARLTGGGGGSCLIIYRGGGGGGGGGRPGDLPLRLSVPFAVV